MPVLAKKQGEGLGSIPTSPVNPHRKYLNKYGDVVQLAIVAPKANSFGLTEVSRDIKRAISLRQYVASRSKDDENYKRWLASYATVFVDSPDLERKGAKKHFATYLKADEEWGNCEGTAKACRDKQVISQGGRIALCHSNPNILPPQWELGLSTAPSLAGFEDSKRPPTLTDIWQKHWADTKPAPRVTISKNRIDVMLKYGKSKNDLLKVSVEATTYSDEVLCGPPRPKEDKYCKALTHIERVRDRQVLMATVGHCNQRSVFVPAAEKEQVLYKDGAKLPSYELERDHYLSSDYDYNLFLHNPDYFYRLKEMAENGDTDKYYHSWIHGLAAKALTRQPLPTLLSVGSSYVFQTKPTGVFDRIRLHNWLKHNTWVISENEQKLLNKRLEDTFYRNYRDAGLAVPVGIPTGGHLKQFKWKWARRALRQAYPEATPYKVLYLQGPEFYCKLDIDWDNLEDSYPGRATSEDCSDAPLEGEYIAADEPVTIKDTPVDLGPLKSVEEVVVNFVDYMPGEKFRKSDILEAYSLDDDSFSLVNGIYVPVHTIQQDFDNFETNRHSKAGLLLPKSGLFKELKDFKDLIKSKVS